MTEAEFKQPLQIPDTDAVYRQAHKTFLDKSQRFPKARDFVPHEDGLSVHWDRFITIEEVYYIIGLSYKKDDTFKTFSEFKLFSFPVNFLRQVEGISEVIHTPFFSGNPAPIGRPNNYAHASVIYQNDEEIRLKLSDYCNTSHDVAYCPVNFELLDTEIVQLRERLNDTKYHRLDLE